MRTGKKKKKKKKKMMKRRRRRMDRRQDEEEDDERWLIKAVVTNGKVMEVRWDRDMMGRWGAGW